MNDIDVRDEQLAHVLDRAVRDLRPVPATTVGDAVPRRRVARTVASVATAAVFVAAMVWAVGQVGDDDRGITPMSTVGTLDGNGWTASYPSTWSLTQVADCGGLDGYHGGFIVSNVDYRFHDAQGGAVSCGSAPVLDGFPSGGVALAVVPVAADPPNVAPTTTLFPLSLDRFHASDASASGPSGWDQPIVLGDREVAVATAWIGAQASSGDRDALAGAVGSLTYRGALEGTVYRDDQDGFTVDVPVGWSVSPVPINTWVTDPREILAMATYPLRPGGEGAIDAQVPSRALDDLGPNDMFIWVPERDGADASYPRRPASFSPVAVCSGYADCEQGRALGLEGIRAWWYYFRDGDHGVYVFVGMGETAYQDQARSREAWEILDSLRFVA
jgi:hypothetical protein